MNDNWEVHIEYRPASMNTFIYVSRRIAPETIEFLIKGGESARTIKTGEPILDEVYFAKYFDDYIGSLIVEALDKKGVKSPSQSFIAGKLEATESHLQDLRKLNKGLNDERRNTKRGDRHLDTSSLCKRVIRC